MQYIEYLSIFKLKLFNLQREERRRLQKLGEQPKVDGGRRLGNSLDDDAMEESIKNSLIAKKARATRGPGNHIEHLIM